MNPENSPLYFSEWLKSRRQELDLTQAQLAQRASCTVFTIRKIEIGERRPSKQLAELLAQALEIPCENQATFIKVARGELGMDRLGSLLRAPSRESQPASRSSAIPGNLPRALTPFIGREPELAALGQLLHDPHCALLTIVGTGGIGKTRLAIEAARHSQDLFPDGVWFVPLAPLKSPTLITPTIADAVEFRFSDPTNLLAQLLRYLHPKRALLVLDNAEHLLDGVGLFTEILKDCSQVKLLVTSRERLNLLSEWVFEVQGLPVPTNEEVDQLEAYSSVALFLQIARRVRAGYELRQEERPWVRNICRTLEGMPLGIELSAAWVGLLSCEEIAKEIERNLDFLTVSMRDLPERHRSMRATLDHSWKLLNDDEKLILSRLSVFLGPFRREAAEEICGANYSVLSSLRNKTLLNRTDQDFFSLHELVRQYAELKLAEDPNEQAQTKDRHAAYYVACLAEWEKALQSSRQQVTLDEMAQVIDNLSQGWRRMITHFRSGAGNNTRFSVDLLPRWLFSLSLFYEVRCRCWEAVALFTESVDYLKSIQGEFEGSKDSSRFNSILAQVTAHLGMHHAYVLQYEQACLYLEEAIRVQTNSQAWVEKAQAQTMLASIYYRQGQYRKSATLLEQSRDVFREAGEDWWYLFSLINLARSYNSLGKLAESEALCLAGFRLVEQRDLSLELLLRIEFAYVRLLQHDYAQAEQLMLENLHLSDPYRNHRMTANIYIDLSKAMLATDRVDLAEKYLQESFNLLGGFGESDDLAYGLLHLGKCFLARSEIEAARKVFGQVIKIGQALDMSYLVYWGWVNVAGLYLLEGHKEKGLKVLLVLRQCPIEYKEAQDEGDHLLADLQAELPQSQVEIARQQVEAELSANRSRVEELANAMERVSE